MKKDNNLNSRSLLFFFLRAFAFSLFINLPALCGMWLHSGYSPAGFSDWDEAYYLQSAMDYGMRAASYLFSFEAKPPLLGDLLGDFYYPHNVTDLLIGLPAYLFLGFPATKLGLILDVICSFLAYITWSAFFGLFTRSRLYSETGAIASLAVPWLFSLDGYGIFGNLQIGSFLYQPIGNYPCVPVLRGVYTQVSYPLFALACYYFKRAVDCTEHHSRQFAAYAGLLAGLLIYVYFYAWGACVLFLVVYSSALTIQSFSLGERGKGAKLIYLIVFFCLGSFIASVPALAYLLYRSISGELAHEGFSLSPPDFILTYWYFSPEIFLFLFFFTGFYLWSSKKRNTNISELCLVALAIFVSELFLMNSQAFLNKMLCPYHFLVFYLRPLFSGIFLLFFMRFMSHASNVAIAGIIILSGLFPSAVRTWNLFVNNSGTIEFVDLANGIKKNAPQYSSVAMIPFGKPFQKTPDNHLEVLTLPSRISAVTGAVVNYYSPGYNHGTDVLLGWLFSGIKQSIGFCPRTLPSLPGDTLTGVVTWCEYHRAEQCLSFEEKLQSFSLCEAFKKYPFDYLIWDEKFNLPMPEWYSDYTDVVWQGETKRYELRKIRKEELLTLICSEPVRSKSQI